MASKTDDFYQQAAQNTPYPPDDWSDQTDPNLPLIEWKLEMRNKESSLTPRAKYFANMACIFLAFSSLAALLFHYLAIVHHLEAFTTRKVNNDGAVSLRPGACQSVAMRRSWRTMSLVEKNAYITAVQCMAKTPSHLHPNSTLYDDFTYINIVNGALQHRAAGELPFHRLYLHVWEQTLRSECAYAGHLPYWDWELDFNDPFRSPIFDHESGFGGDGNKSAGVLSLEDTFVLDERRCIQSGPFTHLRPQWYAPLMTTERNVNFQKRPHCVTRAFTGDLVETIDTRLKSTSIDFSLRRVGEMMEVSEYAEFNQAIRTMSDWVPKAIRGDWASLAAPNDIDPIFHLHLSNVDRLWWRWQQYHDLAGSVIYNGNLEWQSEMMASLTDPLAFTAYPGVKSAMTIGDMISTHSGIMGMCYRY